MEVALGLYLGSRGLSNVTKTRRLHRVSQQQCRGGSNDMWYTPYATQYDRHTGALPCRIQGQEHGYPYHGKVAMPATLLQKTPAYPCGRTWKAHLRKDLIRL